MTREEIRARIVEIGIIPTVRVYSESEALFAAEAICGSGIPIVEVTMTIPGAVGVIGQLMRHRTDIIVGAGTISDVETPSEIMAAWKAGSDFVKVFPCAQVGGPEYIRALKAPFPQIPLIASGGVNQKNAADYIRAGAVALGIGQHLIHQNAIKKRQREWIHELARRYTSMVNEARSAEAT